MVAWVLLGVGGLVMVPIGLANRAWWLLVLAILPLLAGAVLLLARRRIFVARSPDVVRVVDLLGGLRLRRREYPIANVVGLDVYRVAGAERERPSDTWYVRLQIHTTARVFGRIRPRLKNYLLRRYDDRLEALQARDQVARALGGRARVSAAARTEAASVKPPDLRPQGAEGYYQQGMARVRAGDAAGARRAFQQALALAEGPLLRRMIEQRLEELGEARS
jgi:hypothetical protein